MSARARGPGSSVTICGAGLRAAAEEVLVSRVIGTKNSERSGASCPRPWLDVHLSYQPLAMPLIAFVAAPISPGPA